jgi:hypothetical protein
MKKLRMMKKRRLERVTLEGCETRAVLYLDGMRWTGARKLNELSVLGIEGVVSIGSASVTLTGIMRRLKLYLHDDDNEGASKMCLTRRAVSFLRVNRPVSVRCGLGVSRWVVVIGCLMRESGFICDDAFEG